MQATITTLEKTGWLVLLALLSSVLKRRKDHDTGDMGVRRDAVLYAHRASFLLLLFDPIRQGLREGRLRRLTYY